MRSIKDMPLAHSALLFAAAKHKGQVRKGIRTPYIFHCVEVARRVDEFGGTEDEIAAALLHDILEDCDGVSFDDLESRFNENVAGLVDVLTCPAKGNRAARKAAYRKQIRGASTQAHLIKACDMISNLRDVSGLAHNFLPVYLDEQRLMRKAVSKAPAPVLELLDALLELQSRVAIVPKKFRLNLGGHSGN